jgi:hypothetical protein
MRYLLFIVLVAGVTMVLMRSCSVNAPEATGRTRIPTYSWAEMNDIFALEEELNERVRRTQLFRKVLVAMEEALLAQTLPLAEAVEGVYEAARQNNPSFLLELEERYRGMTPRERVALTLVLRLTVAQREGSLTLEQAHVVDRLRCELVDRPGSSPSLREQLDIAIR